MVTAYRKSIGNASNCKDGAAPQKRPGFVPYTAESELPRQEAARSVSRKNSIAALRLGDGEVVGHVSNVPRLTGFNRAACSMFPDWHVENVPHVKRTGNPSDVRLEEANRQQHLLRHGQFVTGKCLGAGPRAV